MAMRTGALTPGKSPARSHSPGAAPGAGTPGAAVRSDMLTDKLRKHEISQRVPASAAAPALASPGGKLLDSYISAKYDRTSHTWVQKTTRFEERDGKIVVKKEVKILKN